MAKPIFKNVHYETVLFFPVPQGITITIHPGYYVIGEHFEGFVKRGVFERVEDTEEIKTIPPNKIRYRQK